MLYQSIDLARTTKTHPDALAIFCPSNDKTKAKARFQDLDKLAPTITQALAREEFTAERGTLAVAYPPDGYRRIFLLGLGPAGNGGNGGSGFDADALRQAGVTLLKAAHAAKISRLALHIDAPLAAATGQKPAQIASALIQGLCMGNFSFDDFKSTNTAANKTATPKSSAGKDAKPKLALTLDKSLADAARRTLDIAAGWATARHLAATPPNVANPRYLADACKKLARAEGLNCGIIDARQAAKMGMGGLVAVGSGSKTPPVLICLAYQPPAKRARKPGKKSQKSAHAHDRPIMLVGKAITFDTGGYSLKPPASMAGMKYDKCGGCAVIGAMHAIARTKPNVPVVALIPAAENAIDMEAYRVDDILTLYNGLTVEVVNTDAEGRLVLADALAYGTKQYNPQAVIDLATLTGGVVVALGSFCAGMFHNHDALGQRLTTAGHAAGERVWQLPLWKEHRDMLSGNHSDLLNGSRQRGAHPIQGAAFLSYFVGEAAKKQLPTIPWAHLDIAGTASVDSDTPLYSRGPTGYGVRLLVELITNWKPLD